MKRERFALQKNINARIAEMNKQGLANRDIAAAIRAEFNIKFTHDHVHRRLQKWGLPVNRRRGRYCVKMKRYLTPLETDQQNARVVERLKNGVTVGTISEDMNLSRSLIWSIAKAAGMNLREDYKARRNTDLRNGPFVAVYTLDDKPYTAAINSGAARDALIVKLAMAGKNLREIQDICRAGEHRVRRLAKPFGELREKLRSVDKKGVRDVTCAFLMPIGMRRDLNDYAEKNGMRMAAAIRRFIRVGLYGMEVGNAE